jgi:hypothetical protein
MRHLRCHLRKQSRVVYRILLAKSLCKNDDVLQVCVSLYNLLIFRTSFGVRKGERTQEESNLAEHVAILKGDGIGLAEHKIIKFVRSKPYQHLRIGLEHPHAVHSESEEIE